MKKLIWVHLAALRDNAAQKYQEDSNVRHQPPILCKTDDDKYLRAYSLEIQGSSTMKYIGDNAHKEALKFGHFVSFGPSIWIETDSEVILYDYFSQPIATV